MGRAGLRSPTRSKTCAFTAAGIGDGKLSECIHAIESLTVEKEGDRSKRPGNVAQLLRGLFIWHRSGWIWEWRQLSSPKPWQFRERVTTNASNVSARYLHHHLDYIQRYPVQEETKTVILTTDADWQRITSIEFRRDFAVGGSSYRSVESGSTTHGTGFW